MTLNDELKNVTVRDLQNVDINSFHYYAVSNAPTISFLRERKILDDSSIEKALEAAVFSRAKNDYSSLVNRAIYLSYVNRPECLAYAIQKGVFSKGQLNKIPLNQGESLEIYCQMHKKEDLLSTLREELINPKSILVLIGTLNGQAAYITP